MQCGVSASIGMSRSGEGGGTSDASSRSGLQRRQQQQPFIVARQISVDAHNDDAIDAEESVGVAGATSDPSGATQALPTSGTVTQVCRKWGVYEDEVYAYKLQEKEIEMHYGKNREIRHLVRSDLKQAKDLQMVESTEARRSHERAAQSLEFQDEILARRLQHELEGEVSAKIKSLELADKEMAEYLQRLECSREAPAAAAVADTGGFDRRLHKPYKTRSSAHRSSDRHEYRTIPGHEYDVVETRSQAGDEFNAEFPRPRVETMLHSQPRRLTEVSPPIAEAPRTFRVVTAAAAADDEESLRLMQEEEDARLARLLQDEESQKKSRDYRDQQLAIEAQDRELAKLLQEQERSKARRARHKYHKPRSTDALQSADPSEHNVQKDEDKRSPSVKTKTNPLVHNDLPETTSSSSTLDPATRPVRPTKLPVLSSYPHEPRLEPVPRRREMHSSRSPQSDSGNVATVIDPTYRRTHSKQGHHQDSTSAASPPVLPTPLTMQSGSIEGLYPLEGEEEYDQLGDDHAPPYMPIQGQKRLPSLEKRKKKDSCKQQ